jgi:hypothetical protein
MLDPYAVQNPDILRDLGTLAKGTLCGRENSKTVTNCSAMQ